MRLGPWMIAAGVVAALATTATDGGAAAAAPTPRPAYAPAAHAPQPRIRPQYVTGQTDSPNWAGYVAPAAAGAFNQVSASWVQPTVLCSQPNAFSAFWVGLDGWAANDGTVEQTGTVGRCTNGVVAYGVWYEMYPQAPVYWNNVMAPGDQMSASVVYTGGAFVLTLSDQTAGWTRTVTQADAGYQRSSAEIVVESPGYNGEQTDPLDRFGAVTFTNSTVNNAALLQPTLPLTKVEMYPSSTVGVVANVSGITNTTTFKVTSF